MCVCMCAASKMMNNVLINLLRNKTKCTNEQIRASEIILARWCVCVFFSFASLASFDFVNRR